MKWLDTIILPYASLKETDSLFVTKITNKDVLPYYFLDISNMTYVLIFELCNCIHCSLTNSVTIYALYEYRHDILNNK